MIETKDVFHKVQTRAEGRNLSKVPIRNRRDLTGKFKGKPGFPITCHFLSKKFHLFQCFPGKLTHFTTIKSSKRPTMRGGKLKKNEIEQKQL